MSVEHRRPLVAFVVVAFVCAVMLAYSIVRSDAQTGAPERPTSAVSTLDARHGGTQSHTLR